MYFLPIKSFSLSLSPGDQGATWVAGGSTIPWLSLVHEHSFLMTALLLTEKAWRYTQGYCATQPSFYTDRAFINLQKLENS